jgi:putative flippase GtrA
MKQSIFKAPLRYFLAVSCGFAVDFFIYSLMIWSEIPFYLANTAAFFVGSIVNVLLIRNYVFPDSRFSLRKDLPLTLIVNIVIFLFGMIVLWILIDYFSIGPYISKILVSGLTVTLNYIIRTTFFRTK